MSVSVFASPSIRMEQLDSHWTDGHEILYSSIFQNPVEKHQVLLNSDKNTLTLQEDLCTFMTVSRLILLRMRNIADKILMTVKPPILCPVTFPPK